MFDQISASAYVMCCKMTWQYSNVSMLTVPLQSRTPILKLTQEKGAPWLREWCNYFKNGLTSVESGARSCRLSTIKNGVHLPN